MQICFKNPETPSWIEIFVANRPGCFQDKRFFKTDIFDFHKLVAKFLRPHYMKQEPETEKYRNHEKCNK